MTGGKKRGPGSVRIVKSETLFDGFLSLEKYAISHETRDGGEIIVDRLVHDHGNAVAVLPVDAARRTVLVVRQLRLPVYLNGGREDGGLLVEACAGLIDGGDDTPEATAAREAEEELGYHIHDLALVGDVYMTPGSVTERAAFFLAAYDGEVDRVSDGGGLDYEGEDIEVLEWTCAELSDMLDKGAIRDAKLLLLAQALRLRRPELFA